MVSQTRGLSKKEMYRAGTEYDPSRWKQSRSAPQQDAGTRAGTGHGSPLTAEKPRPQHQPLQSWLGSPSTQAGAAAQAPPLNPWGGEKGEPWALFVAAAAGGDCLMYPMAELWLGEGHGMLGLLQISRRGTIDAQILIPAST